MQRRKPSPEEERLLAGCQLAHQTLEEWRCGGCPDLLSAANQLSDALLIYEALGVPDEKLHVQLIDLAKDYCAALIAAEERGQDAPQGSVDS